MRLLRKDIRLVLLDEPNSVLDPAAERQLFENILSMRRGKTIVIVLNKFEDTMMKSADLILYVFYSLSLLTLLTLFS